MNEQRLSNDADPARRRDSMLQDLLASMQQLHTRRRRRKQITATVALFILLGGVLLLSLPRTAPQTTHRIVHNTIPETATATVKHSPRSVDIVLVFTDPAVMQRYVVREAPRVVQMINDDQLIAALEAIDRPTGIVRTAQAVWLTAAVTDEELRDNGEARRPMPLPPL